MSARIALTYKPSDPTRFAVVNAMTGRRAWAELVGWTARSVRAIVSVASVEDIAFCARTGHGFDAGAPWHIVAAGESFDDAVARGRAWTGIAPGESLTANQRAARVRRAAAREHRVSPRAAAQEVALREARAERARERRAVLEAADAAARAACAEPASRACASLTVPDVVAGDHDWIGFPYEGVRAPARDVARSAVVDEFVDAQGLRDWNERERNRRARKASQNGKRVRTKAKRRSRETREEGERLARSA
jgi:hypothetical protein